MHETAGNTFDVQQRVSQLTLEPVSLPKEPLGTGAYRSAASFFDFLIDGHSLRSALATDHVGVLSDRRGSRAFAMQLLGEATVDQRLDGRSIIYGCRECLDVDCGGITTRVSSTGDNVLWHDFECFVRNADGDLIFQPIIIGPYIFDAKQYHSALGRFTGQDSPKTQ